MKICVIHPKASFKSATKLAIELQAECINPYKEGKANFLDFDLVFNYGVSSSAIKAKKIINIPWAVENCVSKVRTYELLANVGVPTVNFVRFKKDVPADWKVVVCRANDGGHSNEGLSYVHKGEALPNSAFYTEYFKHKHEIRIVVFRGRVIARYLKKENKDHVWEFEHLAADGFKSIDNACKKAADALGIHFVGFDVIANDPEDFRVLEANSGPIMTPEVMKTLVKELANV